MGGLTGGGLTGLAAADGGALADAAVWAATDLGLIAALQSAPTDAMRLARQLRLPPRRLAPLFDLLAALGILQRADDGTLSVRRVPAGPAPIAGQLVARVLRRDRRPDASEGLATRADLAHLGAHDLLRERAGAALAELTAELVARAAPAAILDAGSGSGAYTAALLEALPSARATLIDRAEALSAARARLTACFGPRLHFVAGDLATVPLGGPYDLVLLDNVLHFNAPATAERIVRRAVESLAPRGTIVVRQPRLAADRSGPLQGVLYAFAMSILSDEAELLDEEALRALLRSPPLTGLEEIALASSPASIALAARRQG